MDGYKYFIYLFPLSLSFRSPSLALVACLWSVYPKSDNVLKILGDKESRALYYPNMFCVRGTVALTTGGRQLNIS